MSSGTPSNASGNVTAKQSNATGFFVGWTKFIPRWLVLAIQFLVSLIITVLSFQYGSKLTPEVLQIVSGFFVVPISVLLLVRSLYLVWRMAYYFLYRSRLEAQMLKELNLPINTRSVEDFDQIDQIHQAQKELLPAVVDAQGNYRALALATYSYAPLAILLVSLAETVWPNTNFGAGLMLSQVTLILIVFLIVIASRAPTKKWVLLRTRAELLRREQYLALAKVGPYLQNLVPANDVSQRVRRLLIVEGDQIDDLVRPEYNDRVLWSEKLTDLSLSSKPTFPDLLDRVKTFRFKRLGKQIAWMRASNRDVLTANFIMLVAVLAFSAASVFVSFAQYYHVTEQVATQTTQLPPPSSTAMPAKTFNETLRVAGLFLPAVVGSVLALQSVFNLRILSQNYQRTAKELIVLDELLLELESSIGNQKVMPTATQTEKASLKFQTLVLRGEQILIDELMRWRMITDRDSLEPV